MKLIELIITYYAYFRFTFYAIDKANSISGHRSEMINSTTYGMK